MYLKKMSITNFRNYAAALDLEFSSGNNLFLGENAQGKSNLLEAVYYLSLAHSFRGARDNDLINFESDFFLLKGEVVKGGWERDISISFSRDKTKQITIDGVKANSAGDLVGNFTSVVFAPEHLRLVRGAPALRRKYLDTQISMVFPKYYHYLKEYRQVVRQRNEVLKSGEEKGLEIWDHYLCSLGAKIISARVRAAAKLAEKVREVFFQISGEDKKLDLSYCSTLGEGEYLTDEKTIYDLYRNKLEAKRKLELRLCATVVGPHRDDLVLVLGGSMLKDFGSQGQHRMAVLSLKLAEVDFIKAHTGECPVLLLDDVMSELDAKRRQYVIDILSGIQVFITATDAGYFEKGFLENSSVKNIVNGKIL